jgi:hypothetical protein
LQERIESDQAEIDFWSSLDEQNGNIQAYFANGVLITDVPNPKEVQKQFWNKKRKKEESSLSAFVYDGEELMKEFRTKRIIKRYGNKEEEPMEIQTDTTNKSRETEILNEMEKTGEPKKSNKVEDTIESIDLAEEIDFITETVSETSI